jgi:hypothetical protein
MAIVPRADVNPMTNSSKVSRFPNLSPCITSANTSLQTFTPILRVTRTSPAMLLVLALGAEETRMNLLISAGLRLDSPTTTSAPKFLPGVEPRPE